jgi:hypothetical protein
MRASRRPVPGRHALTRLMRRRLAFGTPAVLLLGASAVLLLGAALGIRVGLGGQASAPATSVIITGFAATPATITYGHATVTVAGKLVEYGSQTTGVPDEQVQVEFGTSTAISTSTGADGSFSATVSLPKGGNVFAEFNGDASYGYTRTGTVSINAIAARTRVTLTGLPAPVLAGSELIFTGKAEVNVAGSWEPLPGARVELDRVTAPPVEAASGTTGSGGQFSLPATVTGGQYRVTLDAQADTPFSLYASSQSSVDLSGGSYRTRIAAVSLPASPEAHRSFTVTGVAQVWNGAAWTGYAGMPVQYYYQVQGTSTWVYAGAAQTNASGAFSGPASVQPGGLGWQIRVPASGDGNKFLPSASITYAAFITDQTCVTGLTANRLRTSTEVQAQVQDSCATGQRSFGKVSGQVAEVYYHPRGSTTWSLLGQVRTDANGFVDYVNDGALRGSYKVVFPVQGYYLGSTSQTG